MKKIWLTLFFCFPFVVVAQQSSVNQLLTSLKKIKNDTLKITQYYKIADFYSTSDSVKAFYYVNQGKKLSEQMDWEEGIANSNYQLGHIYNNHLNYKKSLHYFKIAAKTSNRKLLSKTYQSMGSIYIYQSDFSVALDYYFRALQIEEEFKNNEAIAKIAANIGTIYYGMQHYTKALPYFNKSAKVYTSLQNQSELAIVYRNLAGVYNSLDDSKKALFFYEKANDLSRKSKKESLHARILSDIALVHFNHENYDKAILNSSLSLQTIANSNPDLQTTAFNYGVLGDSYLGKAKKTKNKALLDSATIHLNKAIQLHKQLNSTRDLLYDYTTAAQIQKLQGDYKRAVASYEMAIQYQDSIYNSDNKETIKNLEDKRAIELRDREIKINNLKLEAKEKQKWYFIFGLGLLGIIGGLLLFQNQNRKKTNKKLQLLNTDLDQKNHDLDEANKTNARFFAILNHDLRSPVYNLIHFLHLQKENPELLDEQTKTLIQTKTMTSAENLLQSMEDLLLWSKGQMENFQPQPQQFQIATLFEDTQKHFSSVENVQFLFENPSNLSVVTDENYLKTIVRNLTGNAIKALADIQNPIIIWNAFHENGKTILSVTDNGKGATNQEFKALYDEKEVVGIKSGLGLHLIRDLAKAIDCEISVDSKVNEGTTITLKL